MDYCKIILLYLEPEVPIHGSRVAMLRGSRAARCGRCGSFEKLRKRKKSGKKGKKKRKEREKKEGEKKKEEDRMCVKEDHYHSKGLTDKTFFCIDVGFGILNEYCFIID